MPCCIGGRARYSAWSTGLFLLSTGVSLLIEFQKSEAYPSETGSARDTRSGATPKQRACIEILHIGVSRGYVYDWELDDSFTGVGYSSLIMTQLVSSTSNEIDSEIAEFAEWAFSSDGLPNLKLLVFGDFFRSGRRMNQVILCDNAASRPSYIIQPDRPVQPKPYRLMTELDHALHELLQDNMDFLTACPPSPEREPEPEDQWGWATDESVEYGDLDDEVMSYGLERDEDDESEDYGDENEDELEDPGGFDCSDTRPW